METKKKYQKPQLKNYGKVTKLTFSAGSANGDAGQNMMVKAEFEF